MEDPMGATVQSDASRLRALVRGTVVTPHDSGYNDARRIFNIAVEYRPRAVVQVASPADVATTLTFARERGLTVSVRGAGYGLTGQCISGDVVIDLAALRGVSVDSHAPRASVRGGTRWGELDSASTPRGLAVPGSRISNAGVVGTVLAGGSGWLSRRLGYTSDHVLAAEVVSTEGRLVKVDGDVRGLGDGVVTSLDLALNPVPSLVLGGMLGYLLPDADRVFGMVADLLSYGRPEFAPLVGFACAPPTWFVPGDLVGCPVLMVVPAWLGDAEAGRKFVAPLRRVAQPFADSLAAVPYDVLQSTFDQYFPAGLRTRAATVGIGDITPACLAALSEAAMTFPNRRTHVFLTHVDGDQWSVDVLAQWHDPSHDASHAQWARDLTHQLSSHLATGARR
jgi:FAD binding domain